MTLRARLIVAVGLLVAAMAVTGVVVVAHQRQVLVAQVDEQLRAAVGPANRAGAALGAGEIPPPRRGVDPAAGPDSQGDQGALSTLWIGEVSGDGVVVQRISPGLGATAQPQIDPTQAYQAAASGGAFTVGATGGPGSFRVLARDRGDGTVTLIGLPLDATDQAIGQLEFVLALCGAVIVAGIVLLGWWVWRLGLRPIKRMTEAADAVRQGDRDRRVDEGPPGTEAGAMAQALNTMLDERQEVEDELRRFVADASHELRTPLTSIHGYVDLYRRGGLREADDLDDALRRISQETNRMLGLVDDLLLLARLDQARPLAREPVDLAGVLRDAASDAAAVAPRRAVTLEVVEPLVVTGDDQRLHQVVTAVVANALVHTPPTCAITLRGTAAGDGGAILEISDDGPGMSAEVAAHAFERFFRGDPARSRHRGGSGLGLSIVDSVVATHGGHVELDSAEGRGTTVRLVLPGDRAGVGGPQETANELFRASQV